MNIRALKAATLASRDPVAKPLVTRNEKHRLMNIVYSWVITVGIVLSDPPNQFSFKGGKKGSTQSGVLSDTPEN